MAGLTTLSPATPRRILVVNAGSSSLKLRVVDSADAVVGSSDLPGIAPGDAAGRQSLEAGIRALGPVDAVGHRVVHGGTEFAAPVRVDAGVIAHLTALTDLAPLHQPASLEALEVAMAALPGIPHVASFDTAFHAGMPAAASTYALPAAWRERWPIRRYGFHGLSHAYAARRAAELLGVPVESLRIVTCHLGAGASLAAVLRGHSVDTTMGFTPLEGLVMATRSGNVDAGLVLWLQRHAGLDQDALADGLEREAGLKGLAGTADMRAVLDQAAQGDAPSKLALDVYLHRLRASIAAMAAALGGMDALVFTGGVGEHAPAIRAGAVEALAFLGLAVDAARNTAGIDDREIGRAGDAVRILVVTSREDLQIAREVRAVLGGSAAG
jgi:acetate kinase